MTPAALLASAGSVVLLATVPATLALIPQPGRPVAVMASPDTLSRTIATVAAEGGTLLGLRGQRFVFAVSSDPDFVARLHRAGLYLVFDSAGVGGCSSDLPGDDLR